MSEEKTYGIEYQSTLGVEFSTFATAIEAHTFCVKTLPHTFCVKTLPGSVVSMWRKLGEPEYLKDAERPGWRKVTNFK